MSSRKKRIYDRRRYKRNSVSVKAASKKRREENPNYNAEYGRNWRVSNPKRRLYDLAKSGAKRSQWAFNLRPEDIPEIPPICPVLGIEIRVTQGEGRTGHAPSLDRIDSTKGYETGNIRIISDRANWLKSDATPEEMILIGKDGKRLLRRKR